MNVAIGVRVKSSPWGGGNQFATSLTDYLRRQGAEVSSDLGRKALDIIVMTDPRGSSKSSSFSDVDILNYLTHVSPRTLVVHRVNECDEGRNTRLRNLRLALGNRCADHTVFISRWLQENFRSRGYVFADASVIRNGASRDVFHSDGSAAWNGTDKLRLVTHHWSDNWMKGFDVYERLDHLLAEPPYRNLFEFMYVGRLPSGLKLPNTQYYPPCDGHELATLLRHNHVYLTAARNEGAGMHHIEGAMCGLPVLYLRSGALPEYCEGFGVAFDDETFREGFQEMRQCYSRLKPRMPDYPYDAERMCRSYEALFKDLLSHRDDILARRTRSRAGARALMMRAGLLDSISHVALTLQSLRKDRVRRGLA